MKMYGSEIKTKAGHWWCDGCSTWNKEYGNATKHPVCVFCGKKKPIKGQQATPNKNEPTETDFALFNILKTATEAQKQKLLRFAEDEL